MSKVQIPQRSRNRRSRVKNAELRLRAEGLVATLSAYYEDGVWKARVSADNEGEVKRRLQQMGVDFTYTFDAPPIIESPRHRRDNDWSYRW